jgi:Protein of unknown function (DUF3040)
MKLHDPFARLSHETARRFRLRGLRLRRTSARSHGAAQGARAREREVRRLAALDRALVTDAPRLAAMFGTFNQLAGAEGAVSSERIPVPPRRRATRVHVAVLLALALLAGLCFTLSTQLHPARPCTTSAAGSTVATSVAYAQEHGIACPAYPSQQ